MEVIKRIFKFLGGVFLFILAWALFMPISIINFILVVFTSEDRGEKYFISSATNIDRFGNYEFRSLLNRTLRKHKVIKLGVTLKSYDFGDFRETISSALGKNQRNGTLSVTGKVLVWILDRLDKDHCKRSIKEF